MTAVKKDPYDKTSTRRQSAHLVRLAENKGKRLPVDLNAQHIDKLDALVSIGYGASAAAVIRKAIDEAHEKNIKST
jgi:hypothetical protein